MKEQAESFHLNGHIIGFRPQTQKLESPYKTPSNAVAVKGLKLYHDLKSERKKDTLACLNSTVCIAYLYKAVSPSLGRHLWSQWCPPLRADYVQSTLPKTDTFGTNTMGPS